MTDVAHSIVLVAEAFLSPHSNSFLFADLELGNVVTKCVNEVTIHPLVDISHDNMDTLDTQVIPNIIQQVNCIMTNVRVINDATVLEHS